MTGLIAIQKIAGWEKLKTLCLAPRMSRLFGDCETARFLPFSRLRPAAI